LHPGTVKNAYKYLILMCLLLTCLGALAWLDPIPQNPSYHQFSDQKILMGIPNGLNVLSNLPFCILGAFSFGFVLLKKNSLLFSSGWHRLAWLCVFAGVFFVGLGSGYYHWMPSNRTLVWDRLPMTIVFMSFSAVLWMERIPVKEGPFTLVLFNVVGLSASGIGNSQRASNVVILGCMHLSSLPPWFCFLHC
jgi:hypothetical protein